MDFSEAVLSQAFPPSEPSLSVLFCGLMGEHAVSKILFSCAEKNSGIVQSQSAPTHTGKWHALC